MVARRLLAAAAFVLLALPVAPALASGHRESYKLTLTPPPERPFAGPMRDRILTGRAAEQAATNQTGSPPIAYPTPEGLAVRVSFSLSYAPDPARAQALVAFLASRLHGPELGKLLIFVASAAEISTECGVEALACYDPTLQEMIVPGDQTPTNQPSLQYVVTHEYGHHIAANRTNFPWSAGRWGPKHWSTLLGVCPGVATGRYFPGDEGVHYFENPGEAWAESYAQYHYPGAVPWRWTSFIAPNPEVFGAVRVDVQAPWKAQHRRTFVAHFHPGGPNVRRFTLPTALDGWVKATVRRPRKLRLRVSYRGLITDHTSKASLFAYDCGSRTVKFTLRRRGGAFGTVRLRLSYPQ